jgi:hypothetical protein
VTPRHRVGSPEPPVFPGPSIGGPSTASGTRPGAGDLPGMPHERRGPEALEDAVVLLAAAKT